MYYSNVSALFNKIGFCKSRISSSQNKNMVRLNVHLVQETGYKVHFVVRLTFCLCPYLQNYSVFGFTYL